MTRVKYHKEGVDKWVTIVWDRQWQKILGESYPRQRSLYQRSKQTPIRAILFDCIKRLFRRKKYLRTFFGSYAPLEDGQHLL